MSRLIMLGALALAGSASALAIAVADDPTPTAVEGRAGPTLKRFASAHAFDRYLKSLERRRDREAKTFDMAVPSPPPAAVAAPAMEAQPSAAPAETANPEITNNQTIGVDEGGIVKQIGHYLVVLQDGRLFSVDLGRGEGAPLRLADRIDVYRSAETAASWYDEMLVLGNRILVTAYNYGERASEITVLRLDEDGRMRREGRFLLSSNDYYSTENYATRLVGDKLVFYAPFALGGYGGRFEWPRLRRADGDGEADAGDALFGPTQVYAPPGKVDWPVLHTISVCPLKTRLDCTTTAFVGPAMREFYVSPGDAFLWIGAPDGLPWSIDYRNQRRTSCAAGQSWRGRADASALLYRLPLDGGGIGAVGVDGIPADQFAFDSRDGRFRALLSQPAAGCAPLDAANPLALLDIPLSAFAPSLRRVAPRAYTPLPAIDGGQLENRFVGPWLVYGGRSTWSGFAPDDTRRPDGSSLIAVPLARPTQATRLILPHNAVRIERAGNDSVVTGYRDSGGLSLSYVSLAGDRARIAGSTLLPQRFESEGRSHAFNAWVRPDGSGVIGLPTTRKDWRADRGWSDSESSDLSFVAIGADKALRPAGELALTGRKPAARYVCKVSCVDWYGNSRPIFTDGRIFALMGTELVEGRMTAGRIGEVARVDLTGTAGRADLAAR